MSAPYIARRTNLHPSLHAPYGITAYPSGFMGAEGQPDLPPVWMPEARVIGTEAYQRGHACLQVLDYDAPTLDAAIDACWAHYANLH
jgi:hypothetical protein